MLELVLSFHHTGHEYEIWVISLESKHLYTLICLTDLTHGFLMDCSVFTLDLVFEFILSTDSDSFEN